MTVLKNDRNDSPVQFLKTALDLSVDMIRFARKFPKGLTFYVSLPLVNTAKEMYANVKKANSVFPTNAHELQLRIDYLIKARACLQVLTTEVDIAYKLGEENIKESQIINIQSEIKKEMGLLTAQVKSDRQRYKDLK